VKVWTFALPVSFVAGSLVGSVACAAGLYSSLGWFARAVSWEALLHLFIVWALWFSIPIAAALFVALAAKQAFASRGPKSDTGTGLASPVRVGAAPSE
jgi:hypothetical protein